jgi:2-keto-3-deoxy-L-rhamnonate aldolase RhmA
MIENTVKRTLAEGRAAVGHWISLPSPAVAELVAGLGPDWLVIDTEHAPTDGETVEDMIRGLGGTGVVPFVRVAGNDPVLIKKALDRGALGVVVPLVNTAEQAERAVSAARFPPDGIRGVAGVRANRYGVDLPAYLSTWNEQVMVICQIETPDALDHVDEIAAVPGANVLFVGPNDLSANLGLFRQFDHPAFRGALDRVLAAARRHHKTAGIMATHADDAVARLGEGFRFISIGSDTRLLTSAVTAALEQVRSAAARV